MSYDLRLRNRCEHRLTGIVPVLDITNLQDLRFQYSMASTFDFKLKINGELVLIGTPGVFEYYLVKDELSIDKHRFKVHFQNPLPTLENDFEAEFIARVDSCPRCRGTEVETDPKPDGCGNFRVVENEVKLFQEVERFETVERDSMVFYNTLGTNLRKLIGNKFLPLISNQVSVEVRQALKEYQRLQTLQRKYQAVTDGERLSSITSVNVSRDTVEKTMLIITARVTAFSGRSVEVKRLIEADRQYNIIPGSTYIVNYM